MITFPEHFKAIKGFPGYYWNIEEEHIYSIKIGGILRRIKKYQPSYYSMNKGLVVPYFQLSKNGKTHYLAIDRIENKLIDPFTIQVEHHAN